MKKQISEKSSKKKIATKISNNPGQQKNNSDSAKDENENPNQEEMTEEEQLEEAKKASKGKAGEYDQSEMIKKMIIENVTKYTLIIAIFVTLAIGVIKVGPSFFAMISGLFSKLFMSAFGK